jgi:uncharacterized protein DUF5658
MSWPMNLDQTALAEGTKSMGASHRLLSQTDGMFPVKRLMAGTGLAAAQIHTRFLMRISALAIAIVQVLDVATTNAALASGGTELNPVMRLSMATLGSLWWFPKASIALFILAYVFSGLTPTPTRRIIALTKIVLAVSALAVVNNVVQLAAG